MRLLVLGASAPVSTSSLPSGAMTMAAHPPRADAVPLPEQAPSVTTVKEVDAAFMAGEHRSAVPNWYRGAWVLARDGRWRWHFEA